MMHDDDKFSDWVRDAGQGYHAPPPTPREELWARIAAGRRRHAERRARPVELQSWMRWTLAAAAVLVLGIAIGRWTAGPGGARVAEADAVGDAAVVYRVAATQYLSRTEAFLTGFRADLRGGRTNTRLVGQARDLLTTTRLMLDSPAGDDPRLRLLLQDLELVLVQISQLEPGTGTPETDLITQGMDQRNVLPNLRSAIPAGPVTARFEGVL